MFGWALTALGTGLAWNCLATLSCSTTLLILSSRLGGRRRRRRRGGGGGQGGEEGGTWPGSTGRAARRRRARAAWTSWRRPAGTRARRGAGPAAPGLWAPPPPGGREEALVIKVYSCPPNPAGQEINFRRLQITSNHIGLQITSNQPDFFEIFHKKGYKLLKLGNDGQNTAVVYCTRIRRRRGIYDEIWSEPKGSGPILPYIPSRVLIRTLYHF